MNKKLRVGISMRVTDAVGYSEKRDSIAHDWIRYFSLNLSNENWMLIPNIGADVEYYLRNWDLNAFILSGGENIGSTEIRDITEKHIVDYAIKNDLPLLGVCRGLQFICHYFGCKIEAQNSDFSQVHRAKRHSILLNGEKLDVNSYHDNRILMENFPNELSVIATCTVDNSIEAVSGKKILGIMWHPERETSAPTWETELINSFFRNNLK